MSETYFKTERLQNSTPTIATAINLENPQHSFQGRELRIHQNLAMNFTFECQWWDRMTAFKLYYNWCRSHSDEKEWNALTLLYKMLVKKKEEQISVAQTNKQQAGGKEKKHRQRQTEKQKDRETEREPCLWIDLCELQLVRHHRLGSLVVKNKPRARRALVYCSHKRCHHW